MKKADTIYCDYAAATPLDERVFAVMEPIMKSQFYNPSSLYYPAVQSKSVLSRARSTLAAVIGGKENEVIFTAGATESINIAIHGVMRQFPNKHCVSSNVEHAAVLSSVLNYRNSMAEVSDTGLVSPEALAQAITDDTVLISIGLANNELGTIQPVSSYSELVKNILEKRQSSGIDLPLYLHCDASQAAGLIDLNVWRLGVDMLTINAAKCYGPKQTGILWIKTGVLLTPFINGGGQERGIRSGTESVANAAGFAVALKLAESARTNEHRRLATMRDELEKAISNTIENVRINGPKNRRLPNILHLSVPDLDGERMVYGLEERGILAATGAACTANKGTVSHVLKAVGFSNSMSQGSLRFSLGRFSRLEDINNISSSLETVVHKERQVAVL